MRGNRSAHRPSPSRKGRWAGPVRLEPTEIPGWNRSVRRPSPSHEGRRAAPARLVRTDVPGEGLSIWQPIHLGLDENSRPVHIALAERTLLIGGEPGSGKVRCPEPDCRARGAVPGLPEPQNGVGRRARGAARGVWCERREPGHDR